jgi:uncharacterized membrane protein YjjP (DUF1212 family)
LENGAESERVEHTIRNCGHGLGCQWSEVLVGYNALTVSYESAGEFHTKVRSTRPRAVDLQVIESISALTHRVAAGQVRPAEFRSALERIQSAPRHYSPKLTAVAVAVGCGAFCKLFHGDWGAFFATVFGASLAMRTRQCVIHRGANPYLSTTLAAAVSGTVVAVLETLFAVSATPAAALSACVLMLVPGVTFIDAVEDAVKGHLEVALARAAEAALVILFSTLGVLLANTFVKAVLG